MKLGVVPPFPPMLGKLERELPLGDYLYEPKWDGFRCLAFRDGAEVELQSRHGNPLARYFPELVEGLRALEVDRLALDGEVVAVDSDFAALMARLHPAASRVERLARETPAAFVAFDLLALGDRPLVGLSFAERRERLQSVLDGARPPIFLTPATDDADVAAAWLDRFEGVIAKRRDLAYEPGKRALAKVKRMRTADCVVAGFRWRVDRPLPSSLLLGVYDDGAALQHVGVAGSFGAGQAQALLDELRPLVAPLEGHPWEHGFLVGGSPVGRLRGAAGRWTPEMTMDWTPVAPVRVAEVSYDQLDGDRFRHPARFRRWRPDREPRSCTFEQFERSPAAAAELLPA
jgi:ATP-dependent DNA ligase